MVYVSPHGAWAASAGVFITYAAHVAVMAPGSSIGAAHPVMSTAAPAAAPDADSRRRLSGTSEQEVLQKVTNFSVANIRNLADLRGRNADWAEQAVRESVAVTADEAVGAAHRRLHRLRPGRARSTRPTGAKSLVGSQTGDAAHEGRGHLPRCR